jgi:hypothetical protein
MFVVCMKTWRDLRIKQLRQSLTIDQRPDTCQLILTNCRNNCFQKITLRLNIAFHILTLIHCYKRQTIWFHCVNVYSLSMSISDVDFLHLSYQRGNQKWAIQRNWQHRVHKTKTNTTKIQHNKVLDKQTQIT